MSERLHVSSRETGTELSDGDRIDTHASNLISPEELALRRRREAFEQEALTRLRIANGEAAPQAPEVPHKQLGSLGVRLTTFRREEAA